MPKHIIFLYTHIYSSFPIANWPSFQGTLGGIKYQHPTVICTNDEITQNDVTSIHRTFFSMSSLFFVNHSMICSMAILTFGSLHSDLVWWFPCFLPTSVYHFPPRFKVCYFTSPNILFLVIIQCLTVNWYSQGTLLIGLEWEMKQMNLLPISLKKSHKGGKCFLLFSTLTISL